MGIRKTIAVGILVTVAAAVAFQTPQLLSVNTEHNAAIQQAKETTVVASNSQKDDEVIPADQVPISLVETIDGDTIKAKVNGKAETIRYLLVDTPESKKPGMCVQPYAKEAATRNDELVLSGNLTIEMKKGDTRDAYGRLLAYVFVDGKSVQETLLREGYARVAYIMHLPYNYLWQFEIEENAAKRNRLKIWSEKNYVSHYGFIGCE